LASQRPSKHKKLIAGGEEAPGLAEAPEEKAAHKLPGRPRGAGLLKVPIALKFTGFIACLVVAFMAWQTHTAIRTATAGLEREINRGGVLLVTAVASVLSPRWILDEASREELVRSLGDFSRTAGAQVLNVVVHDSKGPIATARGESRFSITLGREVEDPEAAAAGVEIREFSYEGLPVRGFSRAIRSPGAGPIREGDGSAPPADASTAIGRVEIYVSAQAIEESRRSLSSAMTAVSITACLVATLGAFLLSGFLARPIRALVKDMKQVSLGHLDHQSQVTSSDEMGELARAFNSMTAALQVAQEAKLSQKAIEHELALASQIQAKLLPPSVPHVPGFDIAVRYVSAKQVSGDYYDFLRVGADHLGIVVADVSGKGIPASLVMTMTRSLLHLAARGETSAARTVELVNRVLAPDLNPGMFVTLTYWILNTRTAEVELVRCGHNPPLLWSAQASKVVRVQPKGIALGLDRQGPLFQAELKVGRFILQPEDILLGYTDGVVEAKDREEKDYSDERLQALLSARASLGSKDLVEAIFEDVLHHQRGCEQSDDITLVAVKRTSR